MIELDDKGKRVRFCDYNIYLLYKTIDAFHIDMTQGSDNVHEHSEYA